VLEWEYTSSMIRKLIRAAKLIASPGRQARNYDPHSANQSQTKTTTAAFNFISMQLVQRAKGLLQNCILFNSKKLSIVMNHLLRLNKQTVQRRRIVVGHNHWFPFPRQGFFVGFSHNI
jgi:hypothetical protein